MKRYCQLHADERVQIATLRYQNFSLPRIVQVLGRHRSTIWREVRRNRAPYDGGYRSARAQERAVARRKRSRRNQQFGRAQFGRVVGVLRQQWSPEQVAGHLRRQGEFCISHETIYRHVWWDRRRGGSLYLQLRGARKLKRKRYGHYDSRVAFACLRPTGSAPACWTRCVRRSRSTPAHGVAIERVLTDRGASYRSKPFAQTCRELGLKQLFTRPYRPQTNGKAERFIQTVTREWAYARSYDSSDQRATFLPSYLHDYNYHRSHSALAHQPPASRLPKTADNLLTYNS